MCHSWGSFLAELNQSLGKASCNSAGHMCKGVVVQCVTVGCLSMRYVTVQCVTGQCGVE